MSKQTRRTGFQDVRDPVSRKLILRIDAERRILEVKTFKHAEPVLVDLKPYLEGDRPDTESFS